MVFYGREMTTIIKIFKKVVAFFRETGYIVKEQER
jgi:hypothetical protein